MSDAMRCGSAMVLMVAASLAATLPANAQDRADREARAAHIAALGARVDSLNAEYTRQELTRLANELRPPVSTIELDTTRIGPLQLVVPAGTDALPAVEALEAAWSEYARMVGRASARFDDVIVTRAMPREEMRVFGSQRVHLFDPYESGRAVQLRAAHSAIGAALTAALPSVARDWLLTGSVSSDARLEDVYRILVLTTDAASHACLAGDVSACLDLIAYGNRPANDDHRVIRLRVSLLAYALRRGGDDAYARMLTDTASIGAQLTNAAQIPFEQLVAEWSAAIRSARPSVRAGVAQSALWTLVWLAILAAFAMRSTRWRLG